MKNKSDIFRDRNTNEVVVIDETGKEIFREQYSKQIVDIAHCIYFAHKYKDREPA